MYSPSGLVSASASRKKTTILNRPVTVTGGPPVVRTQPRRLPRRYSFWEQTAEPAPGLKALGFQQSPEQVDQEPCTDGSTDHVFEHCVISLRLQPVAERCVAERQAKERHHCSDE